MSPFLPTPTHLSLYGFQCYRVSYIAVGLTNHHEREETRAIVGCTHAREEVYWNREHNGLYNLRVRTILR